MTKKNKPSSMRQGSFLIIAVLIMLFIDQVVLQGDRPYMAAVKERGLFEVETTEPQEKAAVLTEDILSSSMVVEEEMAETVEQEIAEEKQEKQEVIEEAPRQMNSFLGISSNTDSSFDIRELLSFGNQNISVHRVMLPEDTPAWKKNAVVDRAPPDWPKVAIMIDDMGMDVTRSSKVMNLPAPLTLAFLPYASGVKKQAAKAHKKGHELMVHMPMEPMNDKLDTGSIVLETGLNKIAFNDMLDKGLSVFDGYVGINNHMGSKLTQDKAAMTRVMKELHRRGLLFVDSRTINTSVAADVAAAEDVPYAIRDVFIDHEATPEFVEEALKKVEYMARYNGYVIAIGHPKDVTIEGLKAWIPTLKEKKIALVPVSAIVEKEEQVRMLSASSNPSETSLEPAPESSPPQPK